MRKLKLNTRFSNGKGRLIIQIICGSIDGNSIKSFSFYLVFVVEWGFPCTFCTFIFNANCGGNYCKCLRFICFSSCLFIL